MAGVLSLKTPSTGLVTLTPTDTATDKTITLPATTGTVVIQDGTSTATVVNLAYTGTLTGGTGVVNLGSGQIYKATGGNVGVGTSSPSQKLTVQGGGANGTGGTRLLSDTLYANGANYEAYGRRQDANGSGGFAPGVLLARVNTAPAAITSDMNLGRVAFGGSYDGTDANVVYGAQIAGYSSGTYSASSAATDILFFTTPSGTAGGTTSGTANFGTERMRLDSSGTLLVGASAGFGNLGKVQIDGGASGNGLNIKCASSAFSLVCFNNGGTGLVYFTVTGSGSVGTITTNGTTTSYNVTSDYRLKENVAPMTGALATVAALKPCTYTWKSNGSDGQGFIAHELQAVVPDAVTGVKDAVDKDGKPQYQGIDTSFLVATVVAALQELKAEFDAYKLTHP
jgi:hypothetical protein